MSWVLLKKIYQELDLDFLQLKGWFGTYLVKVCSNKIPNYLSKLIPGRNEAYKQKKCGRDFYFKLRTSFIKIFFPSSFIEWSNVDTTVQGSGF